VQEHSHRYGSSRISLDVPSNQATIRQRYTLYFLSSLIFTCIALKTLSNKVKSSGTHEICGLIITFTIILPRGFAWRPYELK
jgi:hypothetical protein